MYRLFCKWSNLSLPDISNWNTSNVTNMDSIFKQCLSLSKLPDISKWNTKKVTNINNRFDECISLLVIPHL